MRGLIRVRHSLVKFGNNRKKNMCRFTFLTPRNNKLSLGAGFIGGIGGQLPWARLSEGP